MAEREEEEVYCLCRRSYHPSEFMIECDICEDWFHGSCVGIEEYQANDIENYHCPNCQPEHGPLTLKRRRNWHRRDYSEINDGEKAIQSGTVTFVNKLKKKHFACSEEVLKKVHGSELTLDYFERNGFRYPLMVERKEGLGMKVPPSDFKISDVERYVGSLCEVNVIDVARQDDIRMKMREWTEYYENTWPRKKVLNVISLEFSNTSLEKLVSPPKVVREMDWINRHWPDKLPVDSILDRPQVQKYCLMGVKDSYTDFHVDFGGTSVWYHIVRGEKVFYIIPPTDENLIKYEEWVLSSCQSEVFFGDLIPTCYKVSVLPGNTLFIPTGWIHAVLTPQDSLVFGGNFLHKYNIALQLRVYEMELRLETPLKFCHPCYEALTWFAARNFLKELKENYKDGSSPPEYLIEGLREMVFMLKSWTRTQEKLDAHKTEIPDDINHDRLTELLSRAISKFETPLQPVVGSEGKPEGLRFRIRKGSMGEKPPPAVPTSSSKKVIALRLSGSGSHVLSHNNDQKKRRISITLSVPQVTMVSRPATGEESDSDVSVGRTDVFTSTSHSSLHKHGSDDEGGLGGRQRHKVASDSGEEWDGSEGEEEGDEEYGDFVYPSLVSGSEKEGQQPKGRKRSSDDDDLWIPHGPIKLIKGSIASSPRKKRNARKRSFEHSLSATAAKITKLEQDKREIKAEGEDSEEEELKPHVPLIPEAHPTDPVLGGGSLREPGTTTEEEADNHNTEVSATRRARATAAASAVNAALASSKPKSKPLNTAKQRLGKLLGLTKSTSGRWK